MAPQPNGIRRELSNITNRQWGVLGGLCLLIALAIGYASGMDSEPGDPPGTTRYAEEAILGSDTVPADTIPPGITTTTAAPEPPAPVEPELESLADTDGTTAQTITGTYNPATPPTYTGIHTVGTEIEPGLYRVKGRAETYTNDGQLVGQAHAVDGYGLLLVDAPANLVAVDGSITPIGDPVDPVGNGWSDGTYLVGFDIEPGRYQIGGMVSHLARYDDRLQLLSEVRGPGAELVVIEVDYAVSIVGTLTRMG